MVGGDFKEKKSRNISRSPAISDNFTFLDDVLLPLFQESGQHVYLGRDWEFYGGILCDTIIT